MERPLGVTILAVLDFLGGALCILLGLGFMLGMGIVGTMVGRSGQEGAGGAMAMLAGLGVVAGVIFLISAAIAIAIGWGLWKLKNWARIITIVFSALGLLFGLLGLLGGLLAIAHEPMSGIIAFGFQLIFVIFYAWVIWYMLRPHVKQAFGAG